MNDKYIPIAGACVALFIGLMGFYFYNRRKAVKEAQISLDKDFSKKDYEDLKTDFNKFINEIRFFRILIEDNVLNKKGIGESEVKKIENLISSLTPVELFLKTQNYFIGEKEASVFCHGHQFVLRDFIGNKADKNGSYTDDKKAILKTFIEQLKSDEQKIKEELTNLLNLTKVHLKNRIQ